MLGDDEYDKGLEELRRRSPAHPFLSVIGAPPAKGSILLPCILGSQDKVRSGEGGLERWMKREGGGDRHYRFVVTEKLDGLSALLVVQKDGKKRMYLRGDGVRGVDVSRVLGKIQGVCDRLGEEYIVRGEILLRKSSTPEGSIGRSLVNGWVHRSLDAGSEVPKELSNVRFVAYQVLGGIGLTRSEQLNWLLERGFEIPWNAIWPRPAVTDDFLKKALIERREKSVYPLDGLVVGADCVPCGLGGGEVRNPPDSVAFKAALDEQKAETRVVAVDWNLSRQGIYVPRIQIEPVQIGGATIQWISGHNAGLVESNGIGPGARVLVRRSGDVIPMVESVLEKGRVEFPPEGSWVWDESRVQAVSRQMGGAGAGGSEGDKAILHALQTLGVEGVGPGLCKKLCEVGLDTMAKIWKASPAKVSEAIGAGRGPALLENLRKARAGATDLQLLVASNKLPRGVGERKLRVLFEKEANPRKWRPMMFGCESPPGWSHSSLAELWKPLSDAFSWIDTSFEGFKAVTAPPVVIPVDSAPSAPSVPIASKFVVFTGVRDHELERALPSKGWSLEDAVTKKTTVVVWGGKESGKTKKAQTLGIRLVSLDEFRALL